MYNNHSSYFEYLQKLLETYGIDRHTLSGLSLAGFTTHVLSDINDTVTYNSKQAVQESHVMTAKKLDSLYKHAREVNLFPKLSIPAEMDFILIISEDNFNQVAYPTSPISRQYVIDRSNYITVGDFIYSFDHDIEINVEHNNNKEITYMNARYRPDLYNELPQILNTQVNDTIKVVRRKTQRGWEYHLYMRLKQYSREIFEKEFLDRDYSAFNYTASGELVGIKAYRQLSKGYVGSASMTELDLKMYFETSRTSKDSIYLQFESTNTFTLIHKSQDNGFRPLISDKLVTYIYTTTGEKGNFTYAKQIGEDIRFNANVDTDLDVIVYLEDGVSRGGKTFTNDKEDLRRDIITKKSTRDSIMTENDLLMQINNVSRNNDHTVIKYRNDIVRIFNVFTTLKYRQGNVDFILPTNTMDVYWQIEDNLEDSANDWRYNVYTRDYLEPENSKSPYAWYNASSFLVETDATGAARLVKSTPDVLLYPLMEEFRLGLAKPIYTESKNALLIDGYGELPVINHSLLKVFKGKLYFYNNRLYRALRNFPETDVERVKEGDILALVTRTVDEGVAESEALFDIEDKIYYWLPYYITYVYEKNKNYIRLYDQTTDKKYNLTYNLNKPKASYSFICNWAHFGKDSVFNPYVININVRNNLTNYSLVDNGFIVNDKEYGGYINTNKLQAYLILQDKSGNIVYSDKFKIREYNAIENSNDDYLDMYINMLPSGYIPRIYKDKLLVMSDIEDSWIEVPITDLKATVKIYNIDNDKNRNNTTNITEKIFIEYEDGPDTKEVPGDDGNNKTVHGKWIKIYSNVDYKRLDFEEEEYLVNYYQADVDIFKDMTDLFKIQHSLIGGIVKMYQVPMIQYTFYKYYAYLFKKALEEEYDILNHVHRFQGEFSTSVKFTNTFGYSKYYTVGKTKRPLNNVQLDLAFIVKFRSDDTALDTQVLSDAIAKYVREINFLNFDVFHISRLYDKVMDEFQDSISYLEFVSVNGHLSDNQLIEMNVDNIKNDTVIEKISVPYIYDNGFKYKVTWKVIKEGNK